MPVGLQNRTVKVRIFAPVPINKGESDMSKCEGCNATYQVLRDGLCEACVHDWDWL